VTVTIILSTTRRDGRVAFAATATIAGRCYSADGGQALTGLAKQLVHARTPDGPWQAERDGFPVLQGPSLHQLAGITFGKGRSFKQWRGG
jgi:hypothetical protein